MQFLPFRPQNTDNGNRDRDDGAFLGALKTTKKTRKQKKHKKRRNINKTTNKEKHNKSIKRHNLFHICLQVSGRSRQKILKNKQITKNAPKTITIFSFSSKLIKIEGFRGSRRYHELRLKISCNIDLTRAREAFI